MRKIHDHYYRRAKTESYPARSVYKLMEMDRRYRLVRKNMRVLDIGCSPGSWSLYLLKRVGKGKVVGIDVNPGIAVQDPRFIFVQADIFSLDQDELDRRGLGSFDLIVSDAAPGTTGDKFSDSQASLRLARRVFQVSGSTLKRGGTAAAKVFQGEDLPEFVRSLRGGFREVSMFKPKSSRKESREIYIVARGKYA